MFPDGTLGGVVDAQRHMIVHSLPIATGAEPHFSAEEVCTWRGCTFLW